MSKAPMTKSWQNIIAHYEAFKTPRRSIRAMEVLVRLISESPLAAGLFAWTSHYDLCIVQQEVTYPYNGPFLRISLLSDGDRVEFRYFDTFIAAEQWHRTVNTSEVTSRLLTFLEQLHWFPASVLEPLMNKKS